jgi:neutral trehalase
MDARYSDSRACYCHSQPPLLGLRVEALYGATGDVVLLRRALPLLVREQQHWSSGAKAVVLQAPDGSVHRLSR